MRTAKIFKKVRCLAVRLPKEFQFSGEDVFIRKHGDAVILFPREKVWETFMQGLDSFSSDFMEEGRDQGSDRIRESF